MWYKLVRFILFLLPPEVAHTVTLAGLKIFPIYRAKTVAKPVHFMGIHFKNPVGLAAGLDKNAEYVDVLAACGFGFIEVGSVTPKPQEGNPKPRLFRLKEQSALINRMGFNGCGLDAFVQNLKKIKSDVVLGINIGKNLATPLENALDDYLVCFEAVFPYADYVAVNLSSPNTPGLRDLQHGHYLENVLAGLKAKQAVLEEHHKKHVPLVIKVSPDLTEDEIGTMSQAFLTHNIDGVIVGNTSLSREGVTESPLSHEKGGLSGAPIKKLSTHVLQTFADCLGNKIPLIGLGGIASYQDANEKLNAGAKLVQVYTGFIYEGPGLVQEIATNVQINT